MRRWDDLGPEERFAYRLIAEIDELAPSTEPLTTRALRRIVSNALGTLDDDPRES